MILYFPRPQRAGSEVEHRESELLPMWGANSIVGALVCYITLPGPLVLFEGHSALKLKKPACYMSEFDEHLVAI